MELATGLIVLGGTKIWQRLDLNGVVLCALGGVIAVETRSYAGWFLVSAAILLTLHAAMRRLDRPLRAMPIVYAVALIVFLATPTLLSITSKASLQRLQQSQNFTTGTQAANNTGGANSDNLALEQSRLLDPGSRDHGTCRSACSTSCSGRTHGSCRTLASASEPSAPWWRSR